MKIERPALMVMDMQNDFCKRDGVFARNGFSVDAIEVIIPHIKKVMDECINAGIPVLASKLTILEDLKGNGMGLGHLRELRPFLVKEGYRQGTYGHALIDDLPTPHYEIRKWGYSAMYQTELEKYLSALEVETLVFVGIATNGVVEGTARDAIMRDYNVITLSDCVAGYNQKLHEASLANLGNIGKVISSTELLESLTLKSG